MALIQNGDTKDQFENGSSEINSATEKGLEKGLDKVGKKLEQKISKDGLDKLIMGSIKSMFAGLSSTFVALFLIIFAIFSVTIFIVFLLTGSFTLDKEKQYPSFATDQLKQDILDNFWDVADTSIFVNKNGGNLQTRNPHLKYSGTKIADLIKPYIQEKNLFNFNDGFWGDIDEFISFLFVEPEKQDGWLGYILSNSKASGDDNVGHTKTTYTANINFNPGIDDMVLNAAAYATAIDNTMLYFSTPDEFNNQYTPDDSIKVNEDWSLREGDVDPEFQKPLSEQIEQKSETYTYTDDDGIEHTGSQVTSDFKPSTLTAIKNATDNISLEKKEHKEHSDFYYFLEGSYLKITQTKHWNDETNDFWNRIINEIGLSNTFVPTSDISKNLLMERYGTLYPYDYYASYITCPDSDISYKVTDRAQELHVKYNDWVAKEINWDYITETSKEMPQSDKGFDALPDETKYRFYRTEPVFTISDDTSEWTPGTTKTSTNVKWETKYRDEFYNPKTGEKANITCTIPYATTREICMEGGKIVNTSDYKVRKSETDSYQVKHTYKDISTSIDIPYDFDFTEYKEKLLELKAEALVDKGKCLPDTLDRKSSNTCTLEEATEWVDTVKSHYLDTVMSTLGVDEKYYGSFYGLSDNGYIGVVDYSLSSWDYNSTSEEYTHSLTNPNSVYYKYMTHCNTLRKKNYTHGSATCWGPGACTYVAQTWFYDVYGFNSVKSGGSGNGKQFAGNVLSNYPDKFVKSSTPAPGAILSINNTGNGHVLCIDEFDGEYITITEGSYNNHGDLRLHYTMKYSDFLNQDYIKGHQLVYAVPVR